MKIKINSIFLENNNFVSSLKIFASKNKDLFFYCSSSNKISNYENIINIESNIEIDDFDVEICSESEGETFIAFLNLSDNYRINPKDNYIKYLKPVVVYNHYKNKLDDVLISLENTKKCEHIDFKNFKNSDIYYMHLDEFNSFILNMNYFVSRSNQLLKKRYKENYFASLFTKFGGANSQIELNSSHFIDDIRIYLDLPNKKIRLKIKPDQSYKYYYDWFDYILFKLKSKDIKNT